jgi:hypothetical protein
MTKFNTNLLHYTVYCWLVLRHVSACLNRPFSVQQVGNEFYECNIVNVMNVMKMKNKDLIYTAAEA